MFEFFEKDNLMFLLTLIVILIAMIVAISLFFKKKEIVDNHYLEPVDEHLEKLRLAKSASALVLSVAKTKLIGNEQAAIILKLEVSYPYNEKYNTEASWLVDLKDMENIKQGEVINVKVDAIDKKYIYHPSERIRTWQWD